ncbi:hypothetical protein EVAR_103258_1 [Eumeta japonica]|uniref:Uncharacterized protein n=1 Tax=Eumeta variegata TaxID=151549 RepID=A0A4C1YCQ4_EUMVA|nr:hypothetical protein EVAR_103258_1 [Eumeta japonica]
MSSTDTAECHSPRPCVVKKLNSSEIDLCYQYPASQTPNSKMDAVEYFNTSNSIPYSGVQKHNLECDFVEKLKALPSNELELSMLDVNDNSNTKDFLQSDKKQINALDSVFPFPNRDHYPKVSKYDDDFFLKPKTTPCAPKYDGLSKSSQILFNNNVTAFACNRVDVEKKFQPLNTATINYQPTQTSESEDQSNIGWTYYNKVMTHVNCMLDNSEMPSSASAMYRKANRQVQMQIDKNNLSVMKKRVCVNDPNHFCFICGEYIFKESRLNVTAFVIKAYKNYFGYPLEIKNKPWIPQKRSGAVESASEILAFRLKERNLVTKETRISYYRTREHNLLKYFAEEDNFVFCKDIPGLMAVMRLKNYASNEWRLFIDSSKRSLKCVLLHNGNKLGSLPFAHSTKAKEEYTTIALILDKIKYEEHKWLICVDLKVVNFLLGQQGGFTKYPCFLCLWDSRAKSQHWTKCDWPPRVALVPGEKNVINPPLVSRNPIILPPVKFGDDPLGVITQQHVYQPQIYQPMVPATETSLKMNALAAKYLKTPLSHPVCAQPILKTTPIIDLSFATRNYMERHQLLPGIPSTSKKPQNDMPRFLDVTALKQQPKLL